MRRVLTIAGSTVPVLFCCLLGGCYEEIEGAPPPRAQAEPAATAEPERASTKRSSDLPSASGSTLGQAKNAAKRTVRKLEQHDKDLEKEIEDQ